MAKIFLQIRHCLSLKSLKSLNFISYGVPDLHHPSHKLQALHLESFVCSLAKEVATYFADSDLQAKDSERPVLLEFVLINNPAKRVRVWS